MTDFNVVIEKYNFIIENMPEKKFRYQVKSIYNFIIHFEEIKDCSDKELVTNLLEEYLEFIEKNEVNSNKECQNLFYEYIQPVGFIYKKHASFQYFVSSQSVVVYLIVANLLFLLFGLKYYYLIGLNFIGCSLLVWMNLKSKTTRVYQVGW